MTINDTFKDFRTIGSLQITAQNNNTNATISQKIPDIKPDTFEKSNKKETGNTKKWLLGIGAFALAGLGAFFAIRRRPSTLQEAIGKEKNIEQQVPEVEKAGQIIENKAEEAGDYILTLVIGVEQDILNKLKPGTQLNSEMVKDLYCSTGMIWMGSEKDFAKTKLSKWHNPEMRIEKPTEYDVYHVNIELKKKYDGLQPGVSRWQRHKAFEKICNDGVVVKSVSERLSTKSYAKTEVYTR